MRLSIGLLGLACLTLPPHGLALPDKADPWLITPGTAWGMIMADASEETLRKALGAQNLIDKDHVEGDAEGGEAIQVFETLLYPKDPSKKIHITWKDGAHRKNPQSVSIYAPINEGIVKSLWHTTEGVRIGTSLKELEAINGGPCTLGYNVLHCDGKLKDRFNTPDGIFQLGLDFSRALKSASLSQEEREHYFQGKITSSNDPVAQKLNPRVFNLSMNFR